MYHYAGNSPVRYVDSDGKQIAIPVLPPITSTGNVFDYGRSSNVLLDDDYILSNGHIIGSDSSSEKTEQPSPFADKGSVSVSAGGTPDGDNNRNDDEQNNNTSGKNKSDVSQSAKDAKKNRWK